MQRVTHIEFRILEQLKYELATFTPVAWVDTFRRRLTMAPAAAGFPEQIPTACSSVGILRRPRKSGCRGSRSKFPFLFYLYRSDRCNCLVLCHHPAVGAVEQLCSAVNSLPALSFRLSLASSRLSCGPHHFTFLLPRFLFVSVPAQCFASVLLRSLYTNSLSSQWFCEVFFFFDSKMCHSSQRLGFLHSSLRTRLDSM